MIHRIVIVLARISALLLSTILFLWAASYWQGWTLVMRSGTGWGYWVSSERGCLYFPLYYDRDYGGPMPFSLNVEHGPAGSLGDPGEEMGRHRPWQGAQVFDVSGGGSSIAVLGVFYWVPTFVCCTLLMPWARQRWRARHRLRLGLCVSCGYDLRASSTGCSECGHRPDGRGERATETVG